MHDVFLSYAAEDAAFAGRLAGELSEQRVEVFFDLWRIQPGDVIIQQLEQALGAAPCGIVIISPAFERSRRAMDEYAALATAAMERGMRLIPVLIGNASPPSFAGNRVWRNFTGVSDAEFPTKVADLAAVMTGRPAPADGAPSDDTVAGVLPAPQRPLTPPDRSAFVVCFAAADAGYGRALAAQLRGAGGLPVWSVDDLRPGDTHSWMIRQQLRYAAAVVVVMTPQAQDSEDITLMIIEGRQHRRTFVPVLLRGDVNYHLADTWHLDAQHGGLLTEADLAVLRQVHADHAAGRQTRLPGPPAEAPGFARTNGIRLPTAAGLRRLRDLLSKGEYVHADLLTTCLILEAADRSGAGWVSDQFAVRLQPDLLAGIDAVWAGQTCGQQGFRTQLAMTPDVDRRMLFRELGAALGWRAAPDDAVPHSYHEFVDRAGLAKRAGFFPTLRSWQHDDPRDWYSRWNTTVLAVHERLRKIGG